MQEYPPYGFPWGTLIFGICFQIAMNAWAAWWLLRKAHEPEVSDPSCWTLIGFLTFLGLSFIYREILVGDPRHPVMLALSLMISQIAFTLVGIGLSCLRLQTANKNVGFSFMAGVFGFTPLISCCLVPSLQGSKEATSRSACKNNLKQIGLAFHNYHDTHDFFPDQHTGDPPRSWRVELLPYLDQQSLYDQYDQSVAWDAGSNRDLSKTVVLNYTCPSTYSRNQSPPKKLKRPAPTAYAVPISKGGIYDRSSPLTFKQITDGTSNTFLVVEACGQNIPWAEPRDIEVTEDAFGVNLPSPERGASPAILSSHHAGGAQILMADGSVHFISSNIDSSVLKLLTNASDGQVISEW